MKNQLANCNTLQIKHIIILDGDFNCVIKSISQSNYSVTLKQVINTFELQNLWLSKFAGLDGHTCAPVGWTDFIIITTYSKLALPTALNRAFYRIFIASQSIPKWKVISTIVKVIFGISIKAIWKSKIKTSFKLLLTINSQKSYWVVVVDEKTTYMGNQTTYSTTC